MHVDEEALHIGEGSLSPQAPIPVADEKNLINAQIRNIPPAPSSNNIRLPIRMSDAQKQPPRLLHPFLHNVPMHVRFGLNGFLSNVGFMLAYNTAVVQFEGAAQPSTIYSIVYLIFIPVSHALISLLVFGWPERYSKSLMNNAPVGLTAIALGAVLTEYLDEMNFNMMVSKSVAQGLSSMGYATESIEEDEKGEFYSSLLVLLVTGIWTFVLSVFINSPAETSEKKEN